MNKILLSTIILGAFIGSASAATTVAGGKVTFNGEVTAGACSVDAGDVDKIVTLDTVPVSTFTAIDQLANAKKAFTITLKNCDASTNTVAIAFTGQAVTGKPNVLENTYGAGGAENVGLQLFGPDGAVLPLSTDSSTTAIVPNGQTVIPLSVDYISTTATVAAGKVQSVATFTLTYN